MVTFGAVGASCFWSAVAQPSSTPLVSGACAILPLTKIGRRKVAKVQECRASNLHASPGSGEVSHMVSGEPRVSSG